MLTGLYDNNIQFYFRAFVLPLQIFDLLQFSAQKYTPVIFSSCEVSLIISALQFLAVSKSWLNRVSQVTICLPHFKLHVKRTTLYPLFGDVYLALI